MKLLKKILVSIDFGDQSDKVIAQAIKIGKLFKSEIELIHVIPTAISRECDLEGLLQPAADLLKTYSTQFEEAGLQVNSSHVACAEPFEEIINQSQQVQANMIIMGEKDYEPEVNPDLGVTAWRVVRKSQKPVWIVKRSRAVDIKSILCAIDLSEASGRALKSALTWARQSKSKCHVLHVQDQTHRLPGHYEPLIKPEDLTETKDQQSIEFDEFLKQFDFHQVDWEKHVIDGDPRQAILHAADLFKADIIMLGSIGQNNSSKILIGAVAEHVIKKSKQHVVSFKNEHAIKLEVLDTLNNIKEHFKQGKTLLENGLAEEAIDYFEHCLKEDIMLIPAWEGLAEAYHRFGQDDKAKHALDSIEKIKKVMWEKKVEFELKNRFWK